MKPNKRKIAAACRAMKHVGIAEAITMKAVKELLALYDNSWKFIEEDSYKLLFDVLLPDEAGVTSTNRGASSKVKTEVELQRLESMSLESNPSERQHQNDGVLFSDSGVSQASLRRIRPKSQAKGRVFVNDSEKVRCKNKDGPSDDHTAVEVPTKRLSTRQQEKQASSPFILCSATTPSRKPHWTDADLSTASEESFSSDLEDSQPLLKRTSLKGKEKVMISLSSDSDECQPLLKRTSLRGKEKVVISCSSDSEESQPLLKRTCLRSKEEVMICNSKGVIMNVQIPSNVQTKVVELPTSKTYPSQKKKQALPLPKSCMETMSSITAHLDCEESEDSPILFTRKKKRTFVPADSLVSGGSRPAESPKSCMETISSSMAHLDDGILVSDWKESEDFPTVFARKKRRFAPADNLVSGSPRPAESPTVINIDDSSDSDGCNVDEKMSELTEVKPSIVYERKCVSGLSQMDIVDEDSLDFHEVKPSILDTRDCVLDSFMMDVAPSPPKEELNSSLICKCSPEYDFYLPNMEVMDQRCGESYRNEECVLETESHSIIDENVKFRDLLQLKSSNSLIVIAMKDDHPRNIACPLSFPSEIFVFKNLIKIVPHMPSGIAFCRFGCLHSLVGFPVKESDYICGIVGKRLNVLPAAALQPSISYEVEATQSHHYSHGVVKSCISFEDITRGNEKVIISLADGRHVEDLLTFCYIWKNVVYKKADVKFTLKHISEQACCSQCFGNCLASPVPCGCAIQTGGGFAYTPDGLVKGKFLEECILETRQPKDNYFYCKECPLAKSKNKKSSKPCKGHLLRRFIKECWYKCGCINNCGNRIVQQGISVKLQVFLTPEGKGWGLRVLEDLPKGSFVCEYIGEILTLTELRERNIQSAGKKHTFPVLLDGSWRSECVKDEEALCLDATYYGNVARFINHRCFDASLIQIPVEVETPNRHYYHVALFTTRNVAAMEELTWDYGINFNDLAHPVKPFKCLCRSPYCRGSDFKVQAVQP